MKKSQVATEFLFFVGVAVVVLMIYLAISFNYLNFTLKREEEKDAQGLVDTIRNEINLAARVENGYVREVNLPNDLNGKSYDINISGRSVVVNFEGADYIGLLATDVNFIGGLDPGNVFTLIKENDEVFIPCSGTIINPECIDLGIANQVLCESIVNCLFIPQDGICYGTISPCEEQTSSTACGIIPGCA